MIFAKYLIYLFLPIILLTSCEVGKSDSGSYQFVKQWGKSGTADSEFRAPRGMRIYNNLLYIVDSGTSQKIKIFSKDGVFQSKWGTYIDVSGDTKNYLSAASGIAIDTSGNLFISDLGYYCVFKFNSSDYSSASVFAGIKGTYGSGDGYFYTPYGLTTDSSGNVYVTDSYYDKIQKFSSTGSFVTKWTSFDSNSDSFDSPKMITTDSGGNIYVADSLNSRILVLDSSGTLLLKFGSSGNEDGQFNNPFDIAIDTSGNIFVIDAGNCRIQEFDSTGKFITKFGGYGTGEGLFSNPYGIAVDEEGYVYVSDDSNCRITKFKKL